MWCWGIGWNGGMYDLAIELEGPECVHVVRAVAMDEGISTGQCLRWGILVRICECGDIYIVGELAANIHGRDLIWCKCATWSVIIIPATVLLTSGDTFVAVYRSIDG